MAVPLVLISAALSSWLPIPSPSVRDPLCTEVECQCGEGRLDEREGLRVLYVEGGPYERGYQHGVLLRDEIRRGLREQIFKRLVLEAGLSHFLLLSQARRMDGCLPSRLREEMRGLADGAGISYSDVLVLHSFDDLSSQPAPAQVVRGLVLTLHPAFMPPLVSRDVLLAQSEPSDGASRGDVLLLPVEASFAAFGQATDGGRLFHSLDFAFPEPSLDDILVIINQPRVGNRFVALAWPGAVGVTMGLNEEKISVAGLSSPSKDASLEGIPLSLLLRDVLEYAGDIPTALRLVASARRTTGQNVTIGDGKPADAQAIECSAHMHAVFEAEDDIVMRTNHYLDPGLSEVQDVASQDENQLSQSRLQALRDGLRASRGRLDLSMAIDLLGEGLGADEREHVGGEAETVLGVVIAASDLEMWVVSVVHADEKTAARSVRVVEEL